MKLISVTLHGYKRFAEPSSMNVDGKLIAVVGSNEAGKTSFVHALQHLNNHTPFVSSGGSPETTRNVSIPDDLNIVEAKYLLDNADRAAVSEIPGGSEARWFTLMKRVNGKLRRRTDPLPKRSLQPRREAVRALNDTLAKQDFSDLATEQEPDLQVRLQNLASMLDTDEYSIPASTLSELTEVAAELDSAVSGEDSPYIHDLVQQLRDLAVYEPRDVHNDVNNILMERRPRFLYFTNEDRSLQPEYNLEQVWEDPPAALNNLARLANLDLEALYDAITANNFALVESMEEQANQQLAEQFHEAWSQSAVAVRLRIDGLTLHVLVREPEARFTSIAERSDGLRQFVALLAFATLKRLEQRSILLIDEAETHLHYDAQADLVQMLAKQEVVSKVIYTTHSIGCLPEDLGTGVRFIDMISRDSSRSIIRNWFWESDRPGFSPLLFSMGASTLAFIPVRHAVVTEGISDSILWPTLFREATGRSHLNFQMVPGISEASLPEIIQLDHEAPRTVYLVDSDQGEGELRRQLVSADIPKTRIFSIPDSQEQGLAVEDLIKPRVYVEAVNEELSRAHGGGVSFPENALPTTGRAKAVKDWATSNSVAVPKKRAVAYRLVERSAEETILAEGFVEPLEKLYWNIITVLSGQESGT